MHFLCQLDGPINMHRRIHDCTGRHGRKSNAQQSAVLFIGHEQIDVRQQLQHHFAGQNLRQSSRIPAPQLGTKIDIARNLHAHLTCDASSFQSRLSGGP